MERDPLERHVMNYIRKCFGPVFGHNGRMPLDEFMDAVQFVDERYAKNWAYAPKYPAIQVAQLKDFHWSPDSYDKLKRNLWSGYVQQLAMKHLSPEDHRRFIGGL